jgi:hypothetical protein
LNSDRGRLSNGLIGSASRCQSYCRGIHLANLPSRSVTRRSETLDETVLAGGNTSPAGRDLT